MEKKYTVGPWKVKRSESKPALNIVSTALGRKYKIARCPIEDYGPKYPETNKTELAEVEANAKLIAAAPELLDALLVAKTTIHALHGDVAWDIYDRCSPEMKTINSAIKKATE